MGLGMVRGREGKVGVGGECEGGEELAFGVLFAEELGFSCFEGEFEVFYSLEEFVFSMDGGLGV